MRTIRRPSLALFAFVTAACSTKSEPAPPKTAEPAALDRRSAASIVAHLPVRLDADVRLARVGGGHALASLAGDRARFIPISRLSATVPAKSSDPVHVELRGDPAFFLDIRSEDVSAAAPKEGEVANGAVVFVDAAPGIDVVHAVEPGRVEELRVVRDKAAAITTRHRIRKGPAVADLRLRDGRVEALDRDGRARIASSPETAWDAAGVELPVATNLVKEGDEWILETRVASDAHPFPVTIDPSWSATVSTMTSGHSPAVAFPLAGNKALVMGGNKYVDVFDPYAGIEGQWLTKPPSPLVGWSSECSAIQLPDGKILTAGVSDGVAGVPAPNYPYLSYLYDPATGTSTRVGDMPYKHGQAQLTLTGDNRVVAFGTANGSSYFNGSLDVYDPATKAWTHGVTFPTPLRSFIQAKLPSGKILIAGGAAYGTGGSFSTSVIYDPVANTTTPTGSLAAPRLDAAVATLSDGKIIAIGGTTVPGGIASSAEIYDETSGTWTSIPSKMTYTRFQHVVTKLPDGRLLITGGQGATGTSGVGTLSTTEYYDPVTKTFSLGPSMNVKRRNHAAIVIPNGRVLVAGGDGDSASGYYDSEIYTPDPIATTDPTKCPSGFAADGYCCDRACTGTCEACNLPGKIGICSPVTGAPAAGHGTCSPYLCAGADATGKGVCGTTCGADSGCIAGNYCDTASSACVPLKGSGSGCGRDAECSSGHCADGVCCDTACSGTCSACDLAGSRGTCTAIAAGDPHHGSCGAFACKAGACVTGTCGADADCASKHYCSGGACLTSLGKGATCTGDAQCQSGHCVDGFCCDTACTGACQACDVTPGTCSGVTGAPHGTRSCAPFAKCNAGACLTSCAVDGDCLVGVCDTKTSTCVTPVPDAGPETAPDTSISDTAVVDSEADTATPDSSAPDSSAPDSSAPDSTGDTFVPPDTTPVEDATDERGIADMPAPAFPAHPTVGDFQRCTKNSECSTGHCVEGVCCDTECTDRCHSCALLSNPGKCTLEPVGVDLKNECGPANQCLGTCGPGGECIGSGTGTMCARNRCTGTSTGVGPAYCPSPGGRCSTDDAVPFECAPYACDPVFGACIAQCSRSDECASGFVCDQASRQCLPPPAADDSGGGCSVSANTSGSARNSEGHTWGGILLAGALATLATRRRARR